MVGSVRGMVLGLMQITLRLDQEGNTEGSADAPYSRAAQRFVGPGSKWPMTWPALGPAEKCDGTNRENPSPVVMFRSSTTTAQRRGRILLHQASPGAILSEFKPFRALVAVAVDPSSSSGVEDASSGGHATPAGREPQCHITPAWGWAGAHPLTAVLATTWATSCEAA
jgi:hypothetical protein